MNKPTPQSSSFRLSMDSQNRDQAFFQEFPLFVELDPVIFPVKRNYAELRLQTLDGLGQCRLGNMQIFCRFVRFSYRAAAKIPKLLDFHIISPFSFAP